MITTDVALRHVSRVRERNRPKAGKWVSRKRTADIAEAVTGHHPRAAPQLLGKRPTRDGEMTMDSARSKSVEQWFVSFSKGARWAELQLRYNIGSKHARPVKFFAHPVWRSDEGFSVPTVRGSFASAAEALQFLRATLQTDGGKLFASSPQIIAALRRDHGYAADRER